MLARDSGSPAMSTPQSSRMAALLLQQHPPTSSPLSGKGASSNNHQLEWSFLRHAATLDSGNVLRLMERQDGGTFALFGEDAAAASQSLINSTSMLTFPFGPECPGMCVLVHASQLARLLQDFLLLRDGWRVEMWSWDALRRSWKCARRASPGNLEAVEELLNLETEEAGGETGSSVSVAAPSVSPVIASVLVEELNVSIAWCDLSALRIGYLSFPDNSLLTSLESGLIQLGVREMVVPRESAGGASSGAGEKVRQIAAASGIVLQTVSATEFFAVDDARTSEADLARLVGEETVRMAELTLSVARAMRCLVVHLNLFGLDSNIGAFALVHHNLSDFARLDEAALTSLNIFPRGQSGLGTTAGNRSFSLCGFLDHCRTAAGSRTLNQWLRQPLTNRVVIENRLDLVELFVDCGAARHRLRELVLRGIPDIGKLVKRLVRARSSLQELVHLYQAVAKMHQVLLELENDAEIGGHANRGALETVLLVPLRQLTVQFSPLVRMVEDTIDFEALNRHEYCVRADFDPELGRLSGEKQLVLDRMEPEFQRVCQVLRLEAGKKCKLERNETYGYFFRISRLDAARLSSLRADGPGLEDEDGDVSESTPGSVRSAARPYTELATLRNGVYFTTLPLQELGRRYASLGEQYMDKQAVLVASLLQSAQPFRPAFDVLGTLFSMLDVLLSVAHVAGTSMRPYVRPQFVDAHEQFVLRGARHPCVEVQPSVSFIPNDVLFDRREGRVLQFITGPNMGGKSTFIRQTAIIVIMAQCGFFVPCETATMPVFDAVLVRVGAGDNITRGISTFMAEMLETATILRTATERSLVVIDELGRGTSTCDGIALSRAISTHLASRIGCFTFFATHFHELTALAADHPTLISNLHVSAEVDETGDSRAGLVLLYKVLAGPCDRSFGIHVARAVGFPDAVIRMAEWRADLLEGHRPPALSSEESAWIAQAPTGLNGLNSPPASLQKYFASVYALADSASQ